MTHRDIDHEHEPLATHPFAAALSFVLLLILVAACGWGLAGFPGLLR